MDILPIINKSLEKDKIPSGFETWMIVKKYNMKIIGDIGLHGKPDENLIHWRPIKTVCE